MTGERFENATVQKRANVYYDGQVTSRELETSDGERKTLGIILPGEYTFTTEEREEIEILAGEGRVELPDGETLEYGPGDVFTVPADAEFDIAADEVVDYCCSYG